MYYELGDLEGPQDGKSQEKFNHAHNGCRKHSSGSNKTKKIYIVYYLRRMEEGKIPKAVTGWEPMRRS